MTELHLYQLADVYYRYSPHKKTDEYDKWVSYKSRFKNSIAGDYVESTTRKQDMRVLSHVVEQHAGNTPIDPDVITVHVRVGDVIDGDVHEPETLIDKQCTYSLYGNKKWAQYVKPWAYFEEQLKYQPDHIKDIQIITGGIFLDADPSLINNTDMWTKSKKYLDLLVQRMEHAGYNVRYTLPSHDTHPDEDFIRLFRCKHLIITGGRFAELALNVNKYSHEHQTES